MLTSYRSLDDFCGKAEMAAGTALLEPTRSAIHPLTRHSLACLLEATGAPERVLGYVRGSTGFTGSAEHANRHQRLAELCCGSLSCLC